MSNVSSSDCVVLLDGGVGGGENVDVVGATGVVTREDGLKVSDTVFIGLRDSTEESSVLEVLLTGIKNIGQGDTYQVGCIINVPVTSGDNSSIYTGGIG
jgi:hypothetical protein